AMRDPAARAGKSRSLEEAFTPAAQSLSDSELDLPFLLFYAVDDQGLEARLIAGTGLAAGTGASPRVVDLAASQEASWPLTEVVRSHQARPIDDLDSRLGPLKCGPYPGPPKTAPVLPITPPAHQRPRQHIAAGV